MSESQEAHLVSLKCFWEDWRLGSLWLRLPRDKMTCSGKPVFLQAGSYLGYGGREYCTRARELMVEHVCARGRCVHVRAEV